jgi:hypothetical protein
MLEKVLKSHAGKILISMVWGFGLAALFRRACTGRSCIVYHGPHPSKVKGKVFKHDEKCYKYTPKRSNCDPIDENNVHLEK